MPKITLIPCKSKYLQDADRITIPINDQRFIEIHHEFNTYETTKGNFQREDRIVVEVCRIDENKSIWTDSKTDYEV
jgi:hypothetical protein